MALALIAVAPSACTTTVESSPPGLADAIVRHALPTHAWRVLSGGWEVGLVVRFEEGDTGRFLYVVRNRHNQDLGLVDANGRAYRYRPYEEEPEWLSTGTMLDGALAILGIPGGELQELALDELREQ